MAVILSPPLAVLPAPSTTYSLLHQAVDWPVPTGTPVLAAAGGKVIATPYQITGGIMVHIDHGEGLETNYAHLSSRMVSKGELVRVGQQIARSGSSGITTGAHLHFGVRVNGAWVDPLLYLGRQPTSETAGPRPYAGGCATGYVPAELGFRETGGVLGEILPGPQPEAYVKSIGSPGQQGPWNACLPAGQYRAGDTVAGATTAAGDLIAATIRLDFGPIVPVVLNGAILLGAGLLAWAGLQKILGR